MSSSLLFRYVADEKCDELAQLLDKASLSTVSPNHPQTHWQREDECKERAFYDSQQKNKLNFFLNAHVDPLAGLAAKLQAKAAADAAATSPSLATLNKAATALFLVNNMSPYGELTQEKSKTGPDINAKDPCGRTPLHHAVLKGSVALISLLLSYGADPNIRSYEKLDGGIAPLHIAAQKDNVAIGELLLSYGANINLPSLQTGFTPLISCAFHNSVSFTVLLLSKGADPTLQDKSGFSPHYYAKKSGFKEIEKMLPTVKYDLWKQLKSEPGYYANAVSVQEQIDKQEKARLKKEEAKEKKKKK